MKFPWSKDEECKHLVKYQGTSMDIAGVSVPNIFSLGNVSIKPGILQAAEKAIQYLDMSHFQNCETLKQAPNEESKVRYFDQMAKQQQKLNDIAMAIAAYSSNTNSQRLEETLSNILKSNLELPDSNKDEIKKTLKIDISQKNIKAKEGVEGGKVRGLKHGELDAQQTTIDTEGGVKGPEIDIA